MDEIRIENSDSLQIIRGIPFPKSQRFTEKNIVEAMNYMPHDGDVIIASYPKTGTTWLQYIVLQIISKAQQLPSMDEVKRKLVPFLELVGVSVLSCSQRSNIYMHHIPYHLVQKNRKSKCIYIYRNPEDTAVSYYHYRKSQERGKYIDFEEFFERFLYGTTEYGSYLDHVMSFYTHRNDPNLLLVSYENLHSNTREEILKISKFIGMEHYTYLLQNDDVLNRIIENTSFDSMKKKLQKSDPLHPEKKEKEGVDFFRKGVVGDGKNMLTETQRQRLRDRAEAVLKDTEILRQWFPN